MSEQTDKPDPGAETVEMPSGPVDPDSHQPTRPDHAQRLPTAAEVGGMVGRFHILDLLGAGGMGVVFAAYDPQLDRKVAIKLLRTRGLTPERREREATRLLAEARSMAQLSHPNVVTVYEAGTLDERVFIAMEYVPGLTLRVWLADQQRSVREILDAYIKAGRGLAAGHHAGLIHRDFKPDNVLVGFDGRVRVIDFGLARPSRQADTPAQHDDEPGTGTATFPPSQLSTAGTLFGTPLYMAPEQHEKGDLDARTDQFAFCIGLYEALYGKLPFPSTSYAELSSAVIEGKVQAPAPHPEIPVRVADAVLRGLAANPDERWPSMDALLDELEPEVRRRRGMMIAAAGITGIVAVVATLLVVKLTDDHDDAIVNPCLGGEEQLAGAWDAPIKDRVRSAFVRTKRAHAPHTFERVANALDRFSADWVRDRRSVCEATKLRGSQSEPEYAARMHCIDQRLGELRALANLFTAADPQVVDVAMLAARTLRDSESCTTAAPGSALLVGKGVSLENDLFEIRALLLTRRHVDASSKAASLLERAKQANDPPFEAEVRFMHGMVQSGAGKPVESEQTLRETLLLAARTKSDTLIAQAWTLLIFVLGNQQSRYDDALALKPVAEIAIERAEGDRETLRAELLYNLATTHFTKGEYRHAIEAFEGSLAIKEKIAGSYAGDIATVLNSLAGAYLRAGNVRAKQTFEKALALQIEELGPLHPEVAQTRINLGALEQALGNFVESTNYLLSALSVLEEVNGPDHENVAVAVYSIAVSYNGREEYKVAVPYYERAVGIFERSNKSHATYPLAVVGLADCLEEAGQVDRAATIGERGLALVAATNTSDKVQLAYARYVLGKALWAANRDRPRALALIADARKGFVAGGLAAFNGVVAIDKWYAKNGDRLQLRK